MPFQACVSCAAEPPDYDDDDDGDDDSDDDSDDDDGGVDDDDAPPVDNFDACKNDQQWVRLRAHGIDSIQDVILVATMMAT